ncbi:MAG: YdcF family protein [Candidatus Calescibacterium sp.]|nr:YdcF family protein [Candidatus Calescibacterium sp.]MDW8132096.1 YdcF family protein [Candidatus Calescibacterium sp.]
MVLKKILGSVINIYYITLFIIFILVPKNQKKYIFLIILIFYFFSTDIGSNSAIAFIEKDYLHLYFLYYSTINNPENVIDLYKNANKIIVLGGGIKNNRELSGESLARTLTAIIIHTNLRKYYNITPEIIILGGNLYNNNPSSKYMKMLIENIEPAKIIAETNSLDTHQNVKNLKKLLTPSDKIIVITSAFHMKRTKISFYNNFPKEFIENNITFIPCNFRYKFYEKMNLYTFLPNLENLETTNIALNETIGILYYNLYYKITGK